MSRPGPKDVKCPLCGAEAGHDCVRYIEDKEEPGRYRFEIIPEIHKDRKKKAALSVLTNIGGSPPHETQVKVVHRKKY